MATPPKDARNIAELKFSKAQKTTDEARSITTSDLDAARKKTIRLRKQRLAKEAAERGGAPEEKAAGPAKKKPRRT